MIKNHSLPQVKSEHHNRMSSTTSLRSLLDTRLQTMKLSPTSGTTLNTRDISHLTDQVKQKKLQSQLKEKQGVAQQLLNDYVQNRKQQKLNSSRFSTQTFTQHTVLQEEELDKVLMILDKYSDINFNSVSYDLSKVTLDRKQAMNGLQHTIRQAANKGVFEETQKTSSCRTTMNDLKSANPHYFSSEPPGRQDAINLRKLAQGFLENLQHNDMIDHKAKLQQASDFLFLSLNELIRQVSYNCLERGQLMMAIFKGFLIIFQKVSKMGDFEKQQLQMQNYKQELEQKIEFDNIIDEKDREMRELRDQILKQQTTIRKQQVDFEQLIGQQKGLLKTMELDKQMKKTAAGLISNLNREISELRNKIRRQQFNATQTGSNQLQQHNKQVIPNEIQQTNQITTEDVDVDMSLSQILRDVDQMTYVEVNPDIVVKDAVDEPPVITFSIGLQCEIVQTIQGECQSNLKLIGSEYDKVLNQVELDNHLKEYELKEQLGVFERDNFGINEGTNTVKQEHNGRTNLIRVLDGLPGNIDQLKSMNKQDMFELFMQNMRYMRKILDQEEQFSDSDNSFELQDERRRSKENKDSREYARQSKDSILDVKVDQSQSMVRQEDIQSHKMLDRETNRNIQQDDMSMIANSSRNIGGNSNKKKQPQQLTAPVTTASKFGLTKSEQVQLKTQVSMLIMMYNMQMQKNQNLTKSLADLADLLKKQFAQQRKLMIHLMKTQRTSHRQIVEEFLFEFDATRKQMPEDIDVAITEEDYLVTEVDEEEERERKRQQTFKKKKGRITKALQFNFQQKVGRTSMLDKLMHPGLMLAVRAREQAYMLKKVVSYWPVKNVLKTITQIYDERIRNKEVKDLEMQIFLFNSFLNRYGFKSVAEKKYLQFLLSIIHFSQMLRVNVFARMVCLLSDEAMNFQVEESQFFLQGLEFMNYESSLGVTVVQSESEQKFHVPYLRALDYMKIHLENKFTEEELRELRNDLEQLKESDPKGLNKAGLIDVDIFLMKIHNKYRVITNRTKQFVIHAFQAADLDGNKKINHNEFITLYRHIESQKFKFKEAMDLFDEQADIWDGEEKNLSFNRFTSLCVNNQVFSEAALNLFIGDDDLENRFGIVKQSWPQYKKDIGHTLLELQPYVTPEMYSEWNKIVGILEQRINAKIQEYEVKPVLIAHKVLKLELERLLHVGQQEDDIDELE